jgi:hypothetical protein
MQNGVVYQIFPDRFRDALPGNNTPAGSFFYNVPGGTIVRSNQTAWNTVICDPRNGGGPCPGRYSENFYGGDLQGVTDKLDYLQGLGVTVLYFNPIFESPSNHKYDTTNYGVVDNNQLRSRSTRRFITGAHARGMQVVLDGAFNHLVRQHLLRPLPALPTPDGAWENTGSPTARGTSSSGQPAGHRRVRGRQQYEPCSATTARPSSTRPTRPCAT